MMNRVFKNISYAEFDKIFDTEERCLEYLASIKWNDGFVCQKCGHDHFCKGSKPYSRRCTRCKTLESATANTLFHKCKISLPTAFKISFMVCSNQDLSSQKISEELDLRKMTCWKFKKKIADCIDTRVDIDQKEKSAWKKVLLGN
jgi:two-component system, sensor histidine kinase LadS